MPPIITFAVLAVSAALPHQDRQPRPSGFPGALLRACAKPLPRAPKKTIQSGTGNQQNGRDRWRWGCHLSEAKAQAPPPENMMLNAQGGIARPGLCCLD
jgi:hypothetical protein